MEQLSSGAALNTEYGHYEYGPDSEEGQTLVYLPLLLNR